MSTPPDMTDAEKGYGPAKGSTGSSDQVHDAGVASGVDDHQAPWTTRFMDSFKRDPNASVTATSAAVKGEYDHEAAARATANTTLSRQLKGRHMQMIAIGGSIGELTPVTIKHKFCGFATRF